MSYLILPNIIHTSSQFSEEGGSSNSLIFATGIISADIEEAFSK